MNQIKLADLMKSCDVCSGSGNKPSPPRTGGGSFGQRRETIIFQNGGDCELCGGNGFTLTDSGQAILEFIQKCKNKQMLR